MQINKIILITFLLLYNLSCIAKDNIYIYTKEKHSKAINDIAISEDDSIIATASSDKTIFLWDVKSRNFIKKLKGHIGSIANISINKKRDILVSSSFTDGKLLLWNIKTGNIIKSLHLNIKQTNNMDISNDGRYLVVVTRPSLLIYDLIKLKLIYSEKILDEDNTGSGVQVEFIDNDNKIFISNKEIGAKLYTFTDGIIKNINLPKVKFKIINAAISNNGNLLALQEYNYKSKIVNIYDLTNFQKIRSLYDTNYGSDMSFIPNTNYFCINNEDVFFGSANNKVYSGIEIYDIVSGERIKYYQNNFFRKLSNKGDFYIDTHLGLNMYDIKTNEKLGSYYPIKNPILNGIIKDNKVFTYDKSKNLHTWLIEGRCNIDNIKNKKVYSMSSDNNSKYIAYELHNKIILKEISKNKIFKTILNPSNDYIKKIFLLDDNILCIGYKTYTMVYNIEKDIELARFNIRDAETVKRIHNDILISSSNNIFILDINTMKQKYKKMMYNTSNSNFDVSTKKIIAMPFGGSRIMLYNYENNKPLYSIYIGLVTKSSAVKFSNDGNFLSFNVENNNIKIWDVYKNKLITTLNSNNGKITSLDYSADDKYFISSSIDGMVIVYDKSNYKELAKFISFDKEDWISLTPEGYFTGSQNAMKYLLVRYDGLKVKDFSQLYDHFFRPDLVKLKLVGNEKAYQKAIDGMTYEEALRNPPPKLSFKTIDKKDVKLSGFEYDGVKTNKEKVKLSFNVKEHDNGGIGLIRVYQEGKLIQTIGEGNINKQSANVDTILEQEKLDKKLKVNQNNYIAMLNDKMTKSLTTDFNMSVEDTIAKVKPETTKNRSGTYTLDIELKSGKNEISIEAFNKTNTVTSYRENITINANITKTKPKLYVITAGVNEFEAKSVNNLKYSQNDAKAIKEAAENKMGTVFDKVEVKYLLGKDVTKENILKAAQDISKKAKLTDTVLFYISTHGRAYQGKLYLVPYNNKSVSNWIDFEQTFKAVQSIKALNQIFIIDACESGKANDIVSSVYDSRASVLAKSSGVHVLLATTKGTFAFEHPDKNIKNGVFTHRILQAMKDKTTDKDKDSFISILELSQKLKEPANNTDYQHPVIRNVGSDVKLERIQK